VRRINAKGNRPRKGGAKGKGRAHSFTYQQAVALTFLAASQEATGGYIGRHYIKAMMKHADNVSDEDLRALLGPVPAAPTFQVALIGHQSDPRQW
jgi:hypothetical protein